jgi:dUTP pyrophosphatase
MTESFLLRLKKSLPAGGNELAKTDLAIQIPRGYYGRNVPRSGLALHQLINVGGGVVDEDYHGKLCVILFNHSDKPFPIHRGDRVAQRSVKRVFIRI